MQIQINTLHSKDTTPKKSLRQRGIWQQEIASLLAAIGRLNEEITDLEEMRAVKLCAVQTLQETTKDFGNSIEELHAKTPRAKKREKTVNEIISLLSTCPPQGLILRELEEQLVENTVVYSTINIIVDELLDAGIIKRANPATIKPKRYIVAGSDNPKTITQ